MVKVLIAGAHGGLGRAFAARMEGEFEVHALGRRELDVTRRNEVFSRVRDLRPQVVIDAAGLTEVDRCEHEKWLAYLVNRDGADHLARAAASVDALVVYPSTDLVFDGERQVPYREVDPPNPLSVYGDTKLAGELAVMSACPRHLVLRTGWLFGTFGRSLLNEILEWQDAQEIVFVPNDQRSQPTSQADFVSAAVELIRRGQTGLFHVASDGVATPLEFARKVGELLGPPAIEVRPRRRGGDGPPAALRPRYSVLDCGKIEALGIRMRPWTMGLRECLESMGRKVSP